MKQFEYLEHQFLNEQMADIHFNLNVGQKTEKIPAHKILLAASSRKFGKLFSENVDLKEININGVSSQSAFLEFLRAFYTKCPEGNYTIRNVVAVLALAREFDVGFCTRTCQKFLVQNLPDTELCAGYAVAYQFDLHFLKAYCQLEINSKKAVALSSKAFFECDSPVFYDLLENLRIVDCQEAEVVLNACLFWVQKQREKPGVDALDIQKHLIWLSKHFDDTMSVNGSFQAYAKEHINHIFTSNALINLPSVDSQNPLVIVRLFKMMLATQICSKNDTIQIELKCTKKIVLSGIAFATVCGYPRGTVSVSIRCDEGESQLVVQKFQLKPNSCMPKNVVHIEGGVVLESNRVYIIGVKLKVDTTYYRSLLIENQFNQNDLAITFKNYKPDIFSHFMLNY